MVRSRQQPELVRKLDDASKVVKAATSLLGQTSHLLRNLVTIVGWLILLAASVRLLIDPPKTLSPAKFLAHGAGAAAVLQGVVKVPARWRKTQPLSPPEAPETSKALEPP